MILARPVLGIALLSTLGFAHAGPAQRASSIHVVTAGNRSCPPMNSCASLAGTSWFSSLFERYHFATSNWNPGGSPGVYYPEAVADFVVSAGPGEPTLAYLGSDHPSAVEMPLGAAFNLLTVRGASSCLFRHVSTIDNTVGNVTFLDWPTLDGDPDAFVLVLPEGGLYNPTTVGVYYDAFRLQWGIFNEDLSPMGTNRHFAVFDNTCDIGLGMRWSPLGCVTASGNVCSLGIAAGDPGARLLVTQIWLAAAGVYNPHPIGVYYAAGTWRIFNEDLADMPDGVKFNVALIRILLIDDFESGDTSAWTSTTP